MHELKKFREAQYFLARLKDAERTLDQDVFAFELSAFLSAGRTVLLYALAEVQRQGRQAWYDEQVSTAKSMSFLATERNIDVHQQPVAPVAIESAGLLATGEAHSSSRAYHFLEWDGSETAVDLCELYLAEIEAMLVRGHQAGLLTQLVAPAWPRAGLERRRTMR